MGKAESGAAMGGPALTAYLKQTEQLAGLQRRVQSIQTEIDKQGAIEREAAGKMPTLDGLDTELENVAAAELLKQATAAECARRRDEIEKRRALAQEKAAIVQREVDAARKALSGLRRVLAQAQAELDDRKAASRDVLQAALAEQAEEAALVYITHANGVWERYCQLIALRDMLSNIEGPNIGGNIVQNLYLPTFNLKSFKGLGHQNWPGILYGWELFVKQGSTLEATADAERERLTGLGIVI